MCLSLVMRSFLEYVFRQFHDCRSNLTGAVEISCLITGALAGMRPWAIVDEDVSGIEPTVGHWLRNTSILFIHVWNSEPLPTRTLALGRTMFHHNGVDLGSAHSASRFDWKFIVVGFAQLVTFLAYRPPRVSLCISVLSHHLSHFTPRPHFFAGISALRR